MFNRHVPKSMAVVFVFRAPICQTMSKLRKNHMAFRYLMDFWSKYCPLEDEHALWVLQHATPLHLDSREYLYLSGQKQKNLYFVVRGLLARIEFDQHSDKRRILSIALPGMATMSTGHLYSHTPSHGDIVALRSNTDVLRFPYTALKEGKVKDTRIDTLIDVLNNKEKKYLSVLRRACMSNIPYRRYLQFAEHMPELRRILTHSECADLLGISLSTVHRAQKKWLRGQKTL